MNKYKAAAIRPSILVRLCDKFTVGDGCWLWKSAAERDSYGTFRVGKATYNAYTYVYELLVGPVPEGMELDHLCRRHACVNPGHLEPVTHQENIRRGLTGEHNRRKTHCRNGHPYDATNTHVNRQGSRECRTCKRETGRRTQERKKNLL